MENAPSRASEELKIVDSISSVSGNALMSSWNKARGLDPIKKQSDIDGYEVKFIMLEFLELEEPDEVSDD